MIASDFICLYIYQLRTLRYQVITGSFSIRRAGWIWNMALSRRLVGTPLFLPLNVEEYIFS